MAVDDSFVSHDTKSFVLAQTSYYPLPIHIDHYQLRHYISSPRQDLLYYVNRTSVYCLNAATKTQVHVAELPWPARCTASGHGYICAAGETRGNIAIIQISETADTASADVDSSLPIDLASRAATSPPPLLRTTVDVQLEQIGEDIVNSIYIHRFPAEGDGEDEVVAVLTNNDKTVRIYSLTWNLEITVLDLPFAMNHATISPDGDMLVAVGDKPIGFFFDRVEKKKPSSMKTPEGRTQAFPAEWKPSHEIPLYNPLGHEVEGYFTTAWSPSSQLCALGSECGYITVIDVPKLRTCEHNEDAVVWLISSTRPRRKYGPGAVRTMQFSPIPWDLLIWSEDQRNVCVADLRSGLKTRQILTLDPDEEGVEKHEITNLDLQITLESEDNMRREVRSEADFIRNYRRTLDAEGTAAAVNFATDYMEASSERRQLHRQLGAGEPDNEPHGLTAQERQTLEALRNARLRDDGHTYHTGPRSINYSTTLGTEPRRYRMLPDTGLNPRNSTRNNERDAAARRTMAETLTEFMVEGTRQANEAQSIRSNGPRRRASVVLSNEGGPWRAISGSETTRSPNPIAAVPRVADPQVMASTDEAWRTIEDALAHTVRPGGMGRFTSGPELRVELRRLRQLTQMRERLRTARESGQPVDVFDIRYRSVPNLHDPADGLRSAGLAISPDARTLYCGTEAGIFEFKLNLHSRRNCAAVTPC